MNSSHRFPPQQGSESSERICLVTVESLRNILFAWQFQHSMLSNIPQTQFEAWGSDLGQPAPSRPLLPQTSADAAKLPPQSEQRTSCRYVARTFCNYYLLFNFHVQYDVDYNVHQSFHVCYSRGLEFIMSMTI